MRLSFPITYPLSFRLFSCTGFMENSCCVIGGQIKVLTMAQLPYELILFDVDHTLLDFEASEENALEICWEEYFRQAVDYETYAAAFRKINLSIWHEVEAGKLKPVHVSQERARRVLRHFGLRGGDAAKLGKRFAEGLAAVAKWLPGAETTFRTLAKRYKVGLVTNGLTSVQHPRADALEIKPLLSTFQISEEAGVMKPRIGIFEKALEESGCSADKTLMVGDSVSSDFQGAINAEIDFCWVRPIDATMPFQFPEPAYAIESVEELNALLP